MLIFGLNYMQNKKYQNNGFNFDIFYFIYMKYEYISGELFSRIADVSIYDRNYVNQFPSIKYNCKKIIYNNEPINKDSFSIINNSNIFFVKTDHIKFFIDNILPFISNKFILITHNSDLSSGNNKIIYNNKFLIKWYGQNMIPKYDTR